MNICLFGYWTDISVYRNNPTDEKYYSILYSAAGTGVVNFSLCLNGTSSPESIWESGVH
jgi:hypothetical protein